jgi:hypothetical protein
VPLKLLDPLLVGLSHHGTALRIVVVLLTSAYVANKLAAWGLVGAEKAMAFWTLVTTGQLRA